jgi:hypothetical protein
MHSISEFTFFGSFVRMSESYSISSFEVVEGMVPQFRPLTAHPAAPIHYDWVILIFLDSCFLAEFKDPIHVCDLHTLYKGEGGLIIDLVTVENL